MSGTGIKGKQIADGTIESADIADGTIDSADIGTVSIGDLSDVTIVDSSGSTLGDQQLLVYNTTSSSFESTEDADINVGNVDFLSARMRGHMIPWLDNTCDIGSAGSKIRDLYVSENSFWVGDNHKIAGGKKKKRKTSSPPQSVITAREGNARVASAGAAGALGVDGGNPTVAQAHADQVAGEVAAHATVSIENVSIVQWVAYMQTIVGSENATVSDVFNDAVNDDWEKIIEDGVAHEVLLMAAGTDWIYRLTVTPGIHGAAGTLTAEWVSGTAP